MSATGVVRGVVVPPWAKYPAPRRGRSEEERERRGGRAGELRRLFDNDEDAHPAASALDMQDKLLEGCLALQQRWTCFANPPPPAADQPTRSTFNVHMTVREAKLCEMQAREAVFAWEAAEAERGAAQSAPPLGPAGGRPAGGTSAGASAAAFVPGEQNTFGPTRAITSALEAAVECDRQRAEAAKQFHKHVEDLQKLYKVQEKKCLASRSQGLPHMQSFHPRGRESNLW